MADRLMGLETEYALAGPLPPVHPAGVPWIATQLLLQAAARTTHLPGINGTGMFLANGARFYIDAGGHPEYCTPEVDNPWDVVCHVRAGDLLLREWADHTLAPGRLRLARSNVDYSGSGATWACHESYGYRTDPTLLPPQLIPHLVSRILYSGAGGLNPLAAGIEFCLSPRTCHLTQVLSASSTGERGIFHLKEEPLCGQGWHRLHVLTGESLGSHLGTVLKIGTTALVVALIDRGLRPGDPVRLADPLAALRAYNQDLTGQARAALASGGQTSALEIQQHYLERVESALGSDALPSWAGRVCALWRETLDQLRRDPASARGRLDWAMKHALFDQHLNARGLSPDALAVWNGVVHELQVALRQAKVPEALTAQRVLDPAGPFAGMRAQLDPVLSAQGLDWTGLADFLQLRAQLCEIDLHFGTLGPDSLFARLDAAGCLNHSVPEVLPDGIAAATRTPPSRGRAQIRGQLIRELARAGRRCECDWSAIWDEARKEWLDLSDPFVAAPPGWSKCTPATPPRARSHTADLLSRVALAYDRGDYSQAIAMLDFLAVSDAALYPPLQTQYLTSRFWVECRRGQCTEAQSLLLQREALGEPASRLLAEHVALHRFWGLVPSPQIDLWLRKTDECFAAGPPPEEVDRISTLAHKGRALFVAGRYPEARAALGEAVRALNRGHSHARLKARTLADLADVHRLLGETGEALRCLDEAAAIQQRQAYQGDLADFTLLARAKLLHATGDARGDLNQAEAVQQNLHHSMGLAKTWLLISRLFPAAAEVRHLDRELQQLRQHLPALQACTRTTRILNHWRDWTSGGALTQANKDFFWGL